MRFVGSKRQEFYDNVYGYTARLSAGFKSRALLFKEIFPWSFNETTNYEIIFPTSNTCQGHIETTAANV